MVKSHRTPAFHPTRARRPRRLVWRGLSHLRASTKACVVQVCHAPAILSRVTDKERDGQKSVTDKERDGKKSVTDKERDGQKSVTDKERDGKKSVTDKERDGQKSVTDKESDDGQIYIDRARAAEVGASR